MWTCQVCDAQVEDETWEECWHCSSPRILDSAEIEQLRTAHRKKAAIELHCLRCQQQMTHSGKLIVSYLEKLK
jgi:hypothetical protein